MADKIHIHQICLGDVLFTLKIAFKLLEFGYHVSWQIGAKYNWIADYIKHPNLRFGPPDGEYLTLDLANSIEENHPYDIMTCKYKMIGKVLPQLPKELHNIDFGDWQKYIRINRNKEKENDLFHNYLGLKDNSKYVLANNNFGYYQSRDGVTSNIQNKELPIVWMQILGGYTMFDWIKVIENATEIHTVDTSVVYLIESINTKAKVLNMYPRHSDHVEKLLKGITHKSWQFVK